MRTNNRIGCFEKMIYQFCITLCIICGVFSLTSAQENSQPIRLQTYDSMLHQRQAMRVLGASGGISALVGMAQLTQPDAFIQAQGLQNLSWGVINTGIAIWANQRMTNQIKQGFAYLKSHNQFKTALAINTGLDLVYMGTGLLLLNQNNPTTRGHGSGIFIQGAFLFLFDGINWIIASKH